jgi:hypothetical protein
MKDSKKEWLKICLIPIGFWIFISMIPILFLVISTITGEPAYVNDKILTFEATKEIIFNFGKVCGLIEILMLGAII